jgi:hypothetical protein
VLSVAEETSSDTDLERDTLPLATPGGGPPRRLTLSAHGERIGDRVAHFVPADQGSVDLRCAGGAARIRVTLLQLGTGSLNVHVRGLNCFVKKSGGRPTGGTQLSAPGLIELLAKDQRIISTFRVLYSSPAAGHSVFALGDCNVAIGTDECPQVIALDFGPGADLYFVFQRASRGKDPLGSQTKKLRALRSV